MGNLTAKTSGEIASFMTPSMTNIKSLKVHFSPKQLGTGDPSPENVREIEGWDGVEVNGSGKNLFDKNIYIENFRLKTDGTNYAHNNYYISSFIPVMVGKTYIKNSPSKDAYHRFCTYSDADVKTFIRRVDSSNTITIESGESYIRFCGEIEEKDTAQVELGSTATSYEPYQGNNISYQWTKNIKQWSYTDTTIDDSYSSNNFNGYGNGRWDNVIVDIPSEWFGKELTYSAYIERSSSPLNEYDDIRVWCYGDSTTLFDAKAAQRMYTAEESGRSWVTFIIPAGTTKIGLGLYLSKGSRAYNPQLEYGSEPTEYQPYVGTVYGGYIDLISGELVEEWIGAKKKLSEASNVIQYDGVIEYRFNNTPSYGQIINNNKQKCNITSYAWKTASEMPQNHFYAYYTTSSNLFNRLLLFLVDEHRLDSETEISYIAQLAEPITHQLTPAQLQSFVGQNNFWSNADYVEVEYDLIETIDIQKVKQKIILNQPQLKTISNKIVSFNTDMVAPIKNCKIYFKPIQLGSGDASPTNVRDINGWTGLDSYVNGDKISVDWTSDAGTVYGGYLDLIKGELVIDWIYFLFSRSSKVSDYGTSADGLRKWMTLRITHNVPPYQITPNNGDDYGMFSIGNWRHSVETGKNRAYVNSTYVYAVITTDIEDLTTAEGRTAYFDRLEANNIPIEVVYKRATPLRYQLTPQQLLTFKGENNIWSETNGQQIDVKYWTRKNLTPIPLTNYLENQTWTDNAYITSGGKKSKNTVLASPSHYLTNQILLEAGTYVLSGFSYYVGSDTTNYRIHAYDSTGKWLRQITFQQIDNLSPVDIEFTLDTDTYVNVSIAMDFDGVLAKIN